LLWTKNPGGLRGAEKFLGGGLKRLWEASASEPSTFTPMTATVHILYSSNIFQIMYWYIKISITVYYIGYKNFLRWSPNFSLTTAYPILDSRNA